MSQSGYWAREICPNCITEFVTDFPILYRKELPCPTCNAILGVANRKEILRKQNAVYPSILILLLFDMIAVAAIMLTLNVYLWLIPLGISALMTTPILVWLFFVLRTLHRTMKLTVVRLATSCGNCGFNVFIEPANFCPMCGASLLLSGQLPSNRTEQVGVSEVRHFSSAGSEIGECMVCKKVVKSFDAGAWCPNCRSLFHRTHLLEYLHVHDQCPVCGKRLDENELIIHLPQEANQLAKENRRSGRDR